MSISIALERVTPLLRRLASGLALVVVFALPAAAQEVGVRAGVSANPDQFYFGGHVETAPLVENLHFRPNLEIGLGNDVTLVAVNIEFAYHFETGRSWFPYAGAGPALNFIRAGGETRSEGGFNILAGVQHSGGLFAEVKVGMADSPDFKVGVGYAFKWR